MAKRVADKNIIEGLEMAVIAAESFLKIYYKAKKELEGINSPAPRKGFQAEIDHVISKRRIARIQRANQSRQNA